MGASDRAKNQSRRQRILGLLLLAAVGAAGASWCWQRRVNAPDPRIVIRTDAEAIDSGRKFLAAAQVDTTEYDLSHVGRITTDVLKGYKVWVISWPEKTTTNYLTILVYEIGYFCTDRMSTTNEGIEICGPLEDITRRRFVLEWPKAQ